MLYIAAVYFQLKYYFQRNKYPVRVKSSIETMRDYLSDFENLRLD